MDSGLAGFDPRDVPTYSYGEAARYLGLPVSTVRSWAQGRDYGEVRGEPRVFEPVLEGADADGALLSFTGLVEIHVLASIRRTHRVSLHKVREALAYLREQLDTPHPLARVRLQTDGVDLFLDVWGQLLALTGSRGQFEMRQVVEAYLERIDRDEHGQATRLYPFTRVRRGADGLRAEPRVVVLDPRVAWGRPVLVGSGVPTAVLAERYKAGETFRELAADHGCAADAVEEAIRCELAVGSGR